MDTGTETGRPRPGFRWGQLAIAMLPVAYGVLYFASLPAAEGARPERSVIAESRQMQQEALLPIPEAVGLDPRKVRLGQRLFHDPRLSANGEISCASCHDLDSGGDDGRQFSIGVTGNPTAVNSPTVLNSSLNVAQFWDGRAVNLEEQIDGPIQHPDEMGMTWDRVISVVSEDLDYFSAFDRIYREGITTQSIKDAIATFERSLVTPNARFDQYLMGDETALNEQEQRGYDYFVTYGCASCHQGRNIGGNLFQKLGVVRDFFSTSASRERANLGRYNLTGEEADRNVFKVPSLRNIALTAPYLHDGSIATLEEVIMVMAYFQLGRRLSTDEVDDIKAFLITLTGELSEPVQ